MHKCEPGEGGSTGPPLHLREQREEAQVETSKLSNTDSLLKVDKNFRRSLLRCDTSGVSLLGESHVKIEEELLSEFMTKI